MRLKIGTAGFNKHLGDLVKSAMADGQMSVYEITGSMHAAMCYVDRCALDAAVKAQAHETMSGIIPATTLPKPPQK